MTRKSKQTGAHQPLTHYERTKKFRSSQYGTTTARLSSDSQGNFGDCSLSLAPAIDPVATPSGHIYSREAILEYLLTKTVELKEARRNYDAYWEQQQSKQEAKEAEQKEAEIAAFEVTQTATKTSKKRPREEENALKSTSYWLAEFQPQYDGHIPDPPSDRPPSPFSGEPLRRKDLQSLKLERSKEGKAQCAVSHKTIVTQPVVALCGPAGGHVILEELYDQLVQPTMVCPLTGKSLKPKHVLKLQKGKSGFASSGPVQAQVYRPTIT